MTVCIKPIQILTFRAYWRKILEDMEDDDDDSEEELTEEDLVIQSEELAKNWFKKCENARCGETAE